MSSLDKKVYDHNDYRRQEIYFKKYECFFLLDSQCLKYGNDDVEKVMRTIYMRTISTVRSISQNYH